MKKNKLHKVVLCLSMITPFSMPVFADDSYSLEQVVVVSRHGLRAPLATGDSALARATSHVWPSWDTPGSYLTTRGGVLESYFGKYFADWLDETNLVKKNICPSGKDVYIYTNSMQRTIATGQYFAIGAYPGCDLAVNHQQKFNTMDPIFNPVINDGSESFQQKALVAMNARAGKNGIAGLNNYLRPSYKLAESIVDYKNSYNCKVDSNCDLSKESTALSAKINQEPGVSGPLRTGTIISDALILQLYEGFPMEQVGWGKIKNDEDWKKLVAIKDWYTDVLFSAPTVAKHISMPLVRYINGIMGDKNSAKFNLLVGHDSNIASLLSALDIKDYKLPGQYEKTPIGGKIIFQRWMDNKSKKQLMKVEYVYQTTDQIRHMSALSKENPPQRVTLEMNGCPVNSNGFCDFSDFEKITKALIN
ncbi:bifunctional glucose-1-phosphatase/inositol phosphatase [Aeromonas jandaei]